MVLRANELEFHSGKLVPRFPLKVKDRAATGRLANVGVINDRRTTEGGAIGLSNMEKYVEPSDFLVFPFHLQIGKKISLDQIDDVWTSSHRLSLPGQPGPA